MNLSDIQILELTDLCNAVVDGALDEAGRARLASLVADSEEARRFYVRFMGMSASLHQYAGELQAEAPDAVTVTPRRGLRVRLAWALAALTAAAGLVIAFLPGAGVEAPAADDAGLFVAQITGVKDCPLNPGDHIRRGQRVELAGGVVEITFDCGAQVTLEGPAALDVNSAWDATLESGTLKASVPAEAIGFRVSNPAVDIVDLGTEFSLVAGPGGTAELYVLKGRVEATPREQPAMLLSEQQSRRFGPDGAAEIADAPAKFKRLARLEKPDRRPRPAGMIRCSTDLAAGAGGARVPVPGLATNAARTVAFWVKIPEVTHLADTAPMAAWTLPAAGRAGARPVEIGWNADPDHGPVGAVRTESGRTAVVGSKPVRDGRWHHVAVVFVPHGRQHDRMHVKQYVDGRLDASAAKMARPQRRVRAGGPAEDALWIGCSGAGRETFHGEVDDLVVADRALVPQEIQRLIKAGRARDVHGGADRGGG